MKKFAIGAAIWMVIFLIAGCLAQNEIAGTICFVGMGLVAVICFCTDAIIDALKVKP